MSQPGGGIRCAISNSAILQGSLSNDMLLWTATSNQSWGFGSSNNSNMLMRITSNGYVGIGTTVPSSTLHLASNATANVVITMCNSATGGSPAYVGVGTTGDLMLTTSSNNNLLFNTSNAERMRVTSNGSVGIGTSNPISMLHIYNNTLNSNGVLRISQLNSGTNSNYAGIFMATDDQINSSRFKCAILATGAGAFGVPADLRFCMNSVNNSASTTAAEAKMTILNNGNVGIGTSSPGYTLDVVGNIRANGVPGSIGSVSLERGGGGNVAGYISFQSATGASLGYIGWAGTTTNYLYMHNASPILGYQVGGNFIVNGALSKGSGSFDIPHPVVPGKRLLHSFIEGPRADLIYRGQAKLVGGRTTVNLNRECTGNGSTMADGTFEALCSDPQVFLQNNESWDRVRGSVAGCTLTIECENAGSECMIDWMVVAERKDPTMVQWDKTDENGRMILEHDAVENNIGNPP